jgi:hypothetical protein
VTVDTEALIAAVRAGDIEAAQALLPVDPIVKRAREICGRHFGDPARFLRGEMDPFPSMGAVTEALRTIEEDAVLRMARAACYAFVTGPDDAKYWCDRPTSDFLSGDADDTILMARVVDAMRAA